jgi:hypothetical protein
MTTAETRCECGQIGCRCTDCDFGWLDRGDGVVPCPECRPGQAAAIRAARSRDDMIRRLRARGIAAEIAAERDARRLRAAARRAEEAGQRSRLRVAS